MKRKVLLSIVLILFVITGLVWLFPLSPRKDLQKVPVTPSPKKPVIMINVDSLMSGPLLQMIKEGKAPAFQFLMENGYFIPDMVSSYPTMSMTIDSTILTGSYADKHHVPGLIWFDSQENEMISYGSGFREIWDNGLRDVAQNGIIRLNGEHLSDTVSTIHEELNRKGLQSASINGLLYRGSQRHQLHVPKLIAFSTLLPKKIQVKGPTYLSLGALSHYSSDNISERSIWNRMGMNNAFTVNELLLLIQENRLPSFTIAYFPDLDKELHKKGPRTTKGIEKADRNLQSLLNAYPSWSEAIKQAVWIVHGDSAQSDIEENKQKALIDLDQLLDATRIWTEEKKDADIAIGINERMAYLYLIDKKMGYEEVIQSLKHEDRIAFFAYRDGNDAIVETTDGDQLIFTPGGSILDQYGQSWTVRGNLSILDLAVKEKLLTYKDYPDALARLNGALHSHDGRFLIVEAKPGFECIESHSFDHAGGGAHGSLHKVDSLIPLLVAGTKERPIHTRLVDIKEWIGRLTSQ